MMKEVIRGIESGALGTIGLIAFFVAFVAIVIYVARMRKADRETAKNLPLHDDLKINPSTGMNGNGESRTN